MSEELKFSQEFVTLMPKVQKVYPIPEHDWNKLKSIIKSCVPSNKWSFKDYSLLLFGGGISALLSLIALYNSDKVAPWILNANWIIMLCTLIIGVACYFLDKGINKRVIVELGAIIEEMETIETKYYDPSKEKL